MNENGFNNTRATIKDVAVKANVSLSTVSRALREPDKTPAETVSKVRAAAEALNYVSQRDGGFPLQKALGHPSASSCLPRPTRRSA